MTMLEEGAEIAPLAALSDFLEIQESPEERAWNEFLAAIAEGNRLIFSKAEHDTRTMVSIGRLYECHEGRWSYFLATKNISASRQASTGRPAKSDFHPIVINALKLMGDQTGRST